MTNNPAFVSVPREVLESAHSSLLPFTDVDGEGTRDYEGSHPAEIKIGRCTYHNARLCDFRHARIVANQLEAALKRG